MQIATQSGPIRNLYRTMKPRDAHLCYRYLISRLSVNDQHQRLIDVCRKIRAYGRAAGRFAFQQEIEQTYIFELEALCQLGRYRDAWRQMLAWQRQAPASRRLLNLLYHEAPLLYLNGRYEESRKRLERALRRVCKNGNHGSYELLAHIYKGVELPRFMYDVTLWHIYQALGRNLREWQEWDEFLDGFHRRILQVTNVDREGLRRDSNLLRNLWGELRRIRRERLFTHTTAGERDVVESASVVRKRQEQIARRLRARNEGARRREEKFEELFPELKRLRPLHDPD